MFDWIARSAYGRIHSAFVCVCDDVANRPMPETMQNYVNRMSRQSICLVDPIIRALNAYLFFLV